MLKHADDDADPNWDIERLDGSVLSGRTIGEIEAGLAAPAGDPSGLPGARKAAWPAIVEPSLGQPDRKAFHESGLDLRTQVGRHARPGLDPRGQLRLHSRNGHDVTSQFPELAVLADASSRSGDGGWRDRRPRRRGPSGFRPPAAAHARARAFARAGGGNAGHVLRVRPALLRRLRLALRAARRAQGTAAPPAPAGTRVRFSDHVLEKGGELFDLARQNHLEGNHREAD